MFELISLDNINSIGQREVGKVGAFSYDGVLFYFNSIHSSRVEIINKIGDELIVKTKNSKYVFKQKEN